MELTQVMPQAKIIGQGLGSERGGEARRKSSDRLQMLDQVMAIAIGVARVSRVLHGKPYLRHEVFYICSALNVHARQTTRPAVGRSEGSSGGGLRAVSDL